jgi:glutathione S-transferase
MTLTLCHFPNSCSIVPWLLLKEAGAEFNVRLVNLARGDHLAPEYRRINPKQAVPVLLIDGQPLTENVAILLWIAREFPRACLMPREPDAELQVISFMAWCASGLLPWLAPNIVPQRFCDLPDSEDSVRRCAHRMLKGRYAIAEEMLALKQRDWFFGDYSVADAYFFWAFRRGMQFRVDVSGFPLCQAHLERMQLRPAVRELMTYDRTAMAQLPAA